MKKCWDCGKPAEKGYSYCKSCLEKAKERNIRRREKLKEQGLCRDCAQPVEKGHVYCPTCLEKVNAGIKAMRNIRKKQGLCEICGEKPIYKSGQCQACYQKLLKRNLSRRDSLREAGLCVICSAPVKPRKDGTIPPYCPKHEREVYGRNKRVYWERRTAGLCVQCGEPVEKDIDGKPLYAYCGSCREKKRESKRRRKVSKHRIRKNY